MARITNPTTEAEARRHYADAIDAGMRPSVARDYALAAARVTRSASPWMIAGTSVRGEAVPTFRAPNERDAHVGRHAAAAAERVTPNVDTLRIGRRVVEHAACHPSRNDVLTDDQRGQLARGGKGIAVGTLIALAGCLRCPVRPECAEYGRTMERAENPVGIYGGVTATNRRRGK